MENFYFVALLVNDGLRKAEAAYDKLWLDGGCPTKQDLKLLDAQERYEIKSKDDAEANTLTAMEGGA
jgi:hypothetical protein